MSKESANAGLRIMALIEGAKGVLVLAAGLGLFALVYRDVQSIVEELVNHLHLNPARRFPHIFLQMAGNLTDRRLWILATAATAYSLMRFIEAYGLWRGWQWTKWFAVVSGGVYVPIELHSTFHHFTSIKLVVLTVNALVVAYLSFQLANERCDRTRKLWKPPKAAAYGFLLATILLANAHAAPQGRRPRNGIDSLPGSVRLQLR